MIVECPGIITFSLGVSQYLFSFQATGTVLSRTVATCSDVDNPDTLSFSIENSLYSVYFGINETTSELSLAQVSMISFILYSHFITKKKKTCNHCINRIKLTDRKSALNSRWFILLTFLRRSSQCWFHSLLLCGLFYEAICFMSCPVLFYSYAFQSF